MEANINNRLEQLRERVTQHREMIVAINDEIEHNGFKPDASQQLTIDYICQEGRRAIAEIDRLERLKQNIVQ